MKLGVTVCSLIGVGIGLVINFSGCTWVRHDPVIIHDQRTIIHLMPQDDIPVPEAPVDELDKNPLLSI